jgi:hypothetical protein
MTGQANKKAKEIAENTRKEWSAQVSDMDWSAGFMN